MLIATLPAVHQTELLEKIIAHPSVGGVRYNTGLRSPYPPKETLEKIAVLTKMHDKNLWIDLKNRQLRIVQWAVPNYGKIILNHEIEVDCPCRVYFRGNEYSEVKVVRGNTIYVDPAPRCAVGEGQAINIHGENLKIKGFLTDEDKAYLEAARKLGLTDFMLSFVERFPDISEVRRAFGKPANLALKIENQKGLDFINSTREFLFPDYTLVAARDDLMINIGENKAQILRALEDIISCGSNAIVASRIFSGLETGGSVSLADFSDLRLMQLLGYRNFMLSDGISQFYFDEAMKAWEDFQNVFQE